MTAYFLKLEHFQGGKEKHTVFVPLHLVTRQNTGHCLAKGCLDTCLKFLFAPKLVLLWLAQDFFFLQSVNYCYTCDDVSVFQSQLLKHSGKSVFRPYSLYYEISEGQVQIIKKDVPIFLISMLHDEKLEPDKHHKVEKETLVRRFRPTTL